MKIETHELTGAVANYGLLQTREEIKEEVVEILRGCGHLISQDLMAYLILQIRGN